MDEKPILFNTDMVKAILLEKKTCTRRAIKPQPRNGQSIVKDDGTFRYQGAGDCRPPYQTGDILYVRETWRVRDCVGDYVNGTKGAEIEYRAGGDNHIIYPADPNFNKWSQGTKWRPSIHMPKEAARLFLRVTNIRVERLQDMTEENVFAEGYEDHEPQCYHLVYENYPDSPIPCFAASSSECPLDPPCDHSIPELFGAEVWNATIKKADRARYGWNANPWVWVIEFERIGREEAMEDKQ